MTNSTRKQLAAQVWKLMSDFSTSQFRQKSGALRDLGLTPGHIKALITFSPVESRTMGECAQEMNCDASTATWLIDRLEEKGLVERRPSSTDRRVKEVVLTEHGSTTRARLKKHYSEPPEELLELNDDELEQLLTLLSRMCSVVAAPAS